MVRPARWLPALLAIVLTAGVAGAVPAAAAPPEPAGAAPAASPAQVTLITGDVVELATAGPDRYAATVRPGPGRESVSFHTLQVDGRTLTLPSDVMPYLAEGILDDRLFDVPALVADGNAARDTLPLIVRYQDRPAAPAGALTTARPLASIGGAALAPDRDQLDELWTQLAGGPVAAATGAEPALAGGVAEIWLDAPVAATLDRSVGQVGAPDAWDAGYDGTGTTVAVLDTGIDDTHPDLAGKVRAAADFSGSPSTEDRVGHGTHVAGIVAGTGAASGGTRSGVAPGAELLNGKVLNDAGQGFASSIIEGMEWAASQGADVVNMSLGGTPTDGTDPLSQAVDRIAAETGILFVISAGNNGGDYTVGSPGAATAALTVGAVDRDESLAPFSSRGPRLDDAPKPEITAPGVEIVSARADGVDIGRPVDEHYLSASGTSMSAPHVAGAAALLAQAHPEWDGSTVKDALVSTAWPNPELSQYEQGAGRLDAARAVTGRVHSTGVVDFGFHTAAKQPPPVVDQLTYTNRSGDPVTLDLAVELTNLEGGADASAAVSLDAATVTVPAGASASMPVQLDLAALDRGRHGGVVTATGPDGLVARTVLAASLAAPSHPVTFRGEHADGSVAEAVAYVLFGETHRGDRVGYLLPGPRTEQLEEGTYQLTALFDDNSPQFEQSTLVIEPELEVTGEAEVVLRPDTAVPVRIETPRPAEQRTVLSYAAYRELPNGRSVAHGIMHFSNVQQVSVTPTAPVAAGELEFYSRWQLLAPMVDARVPDGPGKVGLRLLNTSPDPGTALHRLPLVHAGTGTPKELAEAGVAGAAALIESDPNLVWDQDLVAAAADAGAAAVVLARPEHWTPWTSWSPAGPRDPVPAMVAGYQEGREMIAHAQGRPPGEATIQFTVTTSSPYLYDVLHVERDRISDQVVHRVGAGNSTRLAVTYQDTGNEFGWAKEQRFGWRPWMVQAMSNDHQRMVRVGTTRDEWVSAGDSLWQHRVTHYFTPDTFQRLRGGMAGPVESYPDPGRQAAATWFGPVVRPAVPAGSPELTSIREADRLALRIPEFVDAAGHYGFAEADFFSGIEDRVQAQLWRDGTLVEKLPDAFRDVFVAPEPATYRLELTTERDHHWQWATRTETAWEFQSQRPDGPVVLPLLQVDYDVPADRTGRVDGRRPHLLGLALRHQDGLPAPRAAQATVEVSFDDGASWRQVPVFGVGRGELSALVPAGGEAVSLRVHATDTSGNAVTQTVIRAYGLR